MIYLIGGPPKCGKRYLAQFFSSKHMVPWFPTELILSIARKYLPESDYFEKLPLYSLLEKESINSFFSNYSTAQVVDFYINQSTTSWKGIESFIEKSINEGQDFVLKGYHIHPKLVFGLQKRYFRYIRSIFVYRENILDMVTGFRELDHAYDWLINTEVTDKTLVKVAESINEFGNFFKQECLNYGLPCLSVDDNIELKKDRIISYLSPS